MAVKIGRNRQRKHRVRFRADKRYEWTNHDWELAPGQVVGRHLFYNQSGTVAVSRYDGNNTAINSLDDNAIATDKTAYRWENPGAATFANISGYSKGINGLMVDISGAPRISRSTTLCSGWATTTRPVLGRGQSTHSFLYEQGQAWAVPIA